MESRGVAFAVAAGLACLAALAVAGDAAAGVQCGRAAWYDLEGMTASGEPADARQLTAAHRTLPFGTRVKVENLANGRSVVVRVNDRGPFGGGRVIDLSRAAAEKLGYVAAGVARVRVTVVDGDGGGSGGSCADRQPSVAVAAADAVPLPRTRPGAGSALVPPTLVLRFDDAFRPDDSPFTILLERTE